MPNAEHQPGDGKLPQGANARPSCRHRMLFQSTNTIFMYNSILLLCAIHTLNTEDYVINIKMTRAEHSWLPHTAIPSQIDANKSIVYDVFEAPLAHSIVRGMTRAANKANEQWRTKASIECSERRWTGGGGPASKRVTRSMQCTPLRQFKVTHTHTHSRMQSMSNAYRLPCSCARTRSSPHIFVKIARASNATRRRRHEPMSGCCECVVCMSKRHKINEKRTSWCERVSSGAIICLRVK